MLDLKWVLSNLDAVKEALSKRGQSLDLAPLDSLNQKRKALQVEFDQLRSVQNKTSGEIQRLQKEKGDASSLIAEMQKASKRLKEISPELAEVERELETFLLNIP